MRERMVLTESGFSVVVADGFFSFTVRLAACLVQLDLSLNEANEEGALTGFLIKKLKSESGTLHVSEKLSQIVA